MPTHNPAHALHIRRAAPDVNAYSLEWLKAFGRVWRHHGLDAARCYLIGA